MNTALYPGSYMAARPVKNSVEFYIILLKNKPYCFVEVTPLSPRKLSLIAPRNEPID